MLRQSHTDVAEAGAAHAPSLPLVSIGGGGVVLIAQPLGVSEALRVYPIEYTSRLLCVPHDEGPAVDTPKSRTFGIVGVARVLAADGRRQPPNHATLPVALRRVCVHEENCSPERPLSQQPLQRHEFVPTDVHADTRRRRRSEAVLVAVAPRVYQPIMMRQAVDKLARQVGRHRKNSKRRPAIPAARAVGRPASDR
eukprot:768660-Prymnesium_polylepis.2